MTFFTYDDDEIAQDTRDVLAASSELQITEFRLFELAYFRWFGEHLGEEKIERFYVGYMFKATAPFWVRHFCREVLEHAKTGELDPTKFGVFPVPVSHGLVNRGIRHGFVILLVIATLHLVAFLVANY